MLVRLTDIYLDHPFGRVIEVEPAEASAIVASGLGVRVRSLVFGRSHGAYQPGDRAGFSEAEAASLVGRGIAIYHASDRDPEPASPTGDSASSSPVETPEPAPVPEPEPAPVPLPQPPPSEPTRGFGRKRR